MPVLLGDVNIRERAELVVLAAWLCDCSSRKSQKSSKVKKAVDDAGVEAGTAICLAQ